jgi:glyoxylase-like metal-dependent hydrolase (beta-lactamase superfamily II)
MRLENRLRSLGIAPEDVSVVINTHLHWDHCCGNSLFPGARFIVQKKEIEHAENPIPSQYSQYEAFQLGLTPPWVSTGGQFETVDGDCELFPGLRLLLLPGHTPGFQGVRVDTAQDSC